MQSKVRSKKLKDNKFKTAWTRFWAEPLFAMAAIVVAVLLFIFILLPLLAVLLRSFGIGGDGFTFEHYQQFFQRSSYYKSLLNSIMVGIVSTSIIIEIRRASCRE